jgi:GTPase SAR1 family protein
MVDVATLTKILAKPTIQASMPLFKKFKDGISHYFNDGFLDYFSNSLDKYKDIKTLLHRQPTNFYDIYYPTKLSYNKSIISTDSVKDLFSKHNFITIIGDAGSGKSTLIRHLFITSFIESYKAPIFIALRDLDTKRSDLEVYVRENILQNKLAPSDNYLNKLLEDGDFLFFLDGYDEIKSTDKHEITKNIANFIDKFPKNNYILTSRPYSNIEYFKNFHNYQIQDLEKLDQIAFIKQQIKDTRLSEKIVESIKETEENYIDSFLKNSLLLTLYIMAYSKNSSIPSNKYIFYRRVFDVLFAEHDSATKIGFEREIKTQLNQESLEEVLKVFSFLSYFENNFSFNKDYIFDKLKTIKEKNTKIQFRNNDFIDDMKLSIGLWVEDSGLYSFSHRSMQEYFASVYITKISGLENKKKVYEKIVLKVYQGGFDMKNFLSLCYEMDEEFFIENYSLPILIIMRKLFINDDGSFNYKFPYMNDGFRQHKQKSHNSTISYSITDDLMFLIESIITPDIKFQGFLGKLSTVFIKNENHINFNKFITSTCKIFPPNIKEEGEEINFQLPKEEQITQDYINFLYEIKVDLILQEIVNQLDEIKITLENKLSQQKTMEDDFITMI